MFDNIPTVLTSEELLDKAFHRAEKIRIRDRKKETIAKISMVRKILNSSLKKYVKSFPNMDKLPKFYFELLDIMIEIGKIKKSLGALDWARKMCNEIARKISREMKNGIDRRKEAYGRISSIIYQVGKDLKFLDLARKEMQKLPSIDPKEPTVVIAGCPNVGKSSLLRYCSTAKPMIASYPFTTTGIILGHFYIEGRYTTRRCQMVEAPGLVENWKSDIERKAVLALKYLADIIIFMIDPSEHCGYPIQKQLHLLSSIRGEFDMPIIVVENKCDIKSSGIYKKISCTTGEGMEELLEMVINELK